jgi:fermentation-respiration switch protein FrsA (DUF1100 family)
VRNIHAPLLMVHGKRDELANYRNSEQIFANANQPKTLVFLPHAGHNDVGMVDNQQFVAALTDFFTELKQ